MKTIEFGNGETITVTAAQWKQLRKRIGRMVALKTKIWELSDGIEQLTGHELDGMDGALSTIAFNWLSMPDGDEGDRLMQAYFIEVEPCR